MIFHSCQTILMTQSATNVFKYQIILKFLSLSHFISIKRMSFKIIFERCDIHSCWHLNCCPLPYCLTHIAQAHTQCNLSYAAMTLATQVLFNLSQNLKITPLQILDNIVWVRSFQSDSMNFCSSYFAAVSQSGMHTHIC